MTDAIETPDYGPISKTLADGYYRPHFTEGSADARWNIISQRSAINKALMLAFQAGVKAAQELEEAKE